MEHKAIYAFSGDPVTLGHIDVIRRALESFGSLLVAIGDNPGKKYLFSRPERVALAREALKTFANVTVEPFDGLLTDFAYERKIRIIVRGIRNAADFDYESTLFQLGKTQQRGLDFHFLLASPELIHISSGSTKALQLEHGDICGYVPLHVKAALERKLSGQVFLGVTGEIAAGKSFVSGEIQRKMEARGISCHHVDMDHLAYEILERADEPIYRDVRQKLVAEFGKEILSVTGFVDRKEFGKRIFGSADSLAKVAAIMREPMLLKLKRTIQGKHGLILLNFALLAEAGWLNLCNNRVILVEASLEERLRRLGERGWAPPQIEQRVNAQLSAPAKYAKIREAIARSGYGKIWEFVNIEHRSEASIENLIASLSEELRLEVTAHEELSAS